jgi:hypothetical protein
VTDILSDMPRKPPMRGRPFRIDDETYEAAMRAAAARGEVLAEEVRQFLVEYGWDFREDDPKRRHR